MFIKRVSRITNEVYVDSNIIYLLEIMILFYFSIQKIISEFSKFLLIHI